MRAGSFSTVSPMVLEGGANEGRGGVSNNNYEGGAMMQTVKKWKVFPGKNQFCCDGRVVTSRQPYIFYMTCVIVIVISGLFFAFDCRYLWYKLTPAVPLISAFLFVFVMATLVRTSWSDPGIIPRATSAEASDIERLIEAAAGAGLTPADPHQAPRLRDVTVNSVSMKLKYCATCKIFRPPRASHCSTCDNCVERFDHHCPWVGNCIGRRNYRYFYLFLVSVTIDCVYICAFSITTLVLNSLNSDFVTALQSYPTSIVEAIVSFISLLSVIGLAGFHTFLAACNLTTNEDIKKAHSKGGKNPYDRGSWCTNYCEVVCGPTPPSLIDARGTVTVERGTTNQNRASGIGASSHRHAPSLQRYDQRTNLSTLNGSMATGSTMVVNNGFTDTGSMFAVNNGFTKNGNTAATSNGSGTVSSNGSSTMATRFNTNRPYPTQAFTT